MVEHTDGDINDCSFGDSDSIDDCCPLAVAITSKHSYIITMHAWLHNVVRHGSHILWKVLTLLLEGECEDFLAEHCPDR